MEKPLLTIGELIDQLSIINVKMWHVDEKMSKKLKLAKTEKDPQRKLELKAAAGSLAEQARNLNAKRTTVREAINQMYHGWNTGSDKIEYAMGRGDE